MWACREWGGFAYTRCHNAKGEQRPGQVRPMNDSCAVRGPPPPAGGACLQDAAAPTLQLPGCALSAAALPVLTRRRSAAHR